MSQQIIVRNAPRPASRFAGREFLVRVIERGDHYGLNNRLVHAEKEPFVEFWDLSHSGDPRFGPDGQFVSRYHAFVLASHPPDVGLDLMGHEPAWKLDAAAMKKVIQLAQQVTYGERGWREERQRARSASRMPKKKRASRRPRPGTKKR